MTMQLTRKILAGALVFTAFIALSAASASAHPETSCHNHWGSLLKEEAIAREAPSHVVNVRAGRHACFDRLVIDLDGPASNYTVRYAVTTGMAGTDNPIALRGGAFLDVSVNAPSTDDDGVNPTYEPANPSEAVSVRGFSTFRQFAYVNSFEGHTDFGLGVRARLPFRTFVLDGPGSGSRLVIDVAHVW